MQRINKTQVNADAFKALGLMTDAQVGKHQSPVDALCSVLQDRLKFNEGERDLVCLHHEFTVRNANGQSVSTSFSEIHSYMQEKHSSSLVEYGDVNGYTAMSKTVALPAAIAADLILTGTPIFL